MDTNRKQSSFSGDWAYIRKSFDDKKQKYFNVRENTVIESGIVKYPNGNVDTVIGATKPKSVWIEEDFKSDVVKIYKEDLEGIERICNISYFLFGKEYIEIPKSVKLIEGGWCGKVETEEEEVALKKIVVFWQEPENIEVCPGLYYKNIILEVPKGTKEKYMNLKPWADCVIVEREK